jgi:catechol 2,3-dioxygenase-like lactoylglutathione lyase family enzyme
MVIAPGRLLCPVSDMTRSVAFYRDLLGLEVLYESEHWSQLRLGPVSIGLHPGLPSASPGGGWVIGVEVADLDQLRRVLAEAGYPTDAQLHQTPAGVAMDFRDPDGNPLQAMAVGARLDDLA